MATALEFVSVAEGIETEEQRALLQDLGYQYGQGYLFSRPLPADRMGELWARGRRSTGRSFAGTGVLTQ
jgi:EAL domain-containing protein (putative c-di-GMP-specific phosphodiesterase class I)